MVHELFCEILTKLARYIIKHRRKGLIMKFLFVFYIRSLFLSLFLRYYNYSFSLNLFMYLFLLFWGGGAVMGLS